MKENNNYNFFVYDHASTNKIVKRSVNPPL